MELDGDYNSGKMNGAMLFVHEKGTMISYGRLASVKVSKVTHPSAHPLDGVNKKYRIHQVTELNFIRPSHTNV